MRDLTIVELKLVGAGLGSDDLALWVFVLANLLMLPVILIHAAGHWLSLLLCYEPRYPHAIEEAGR